MNRPRKKGNKDLPANLYANKSGSKVYYSYLRPDTGTRHGMGADKARAIEAAKRLNAILMTGSGCMVDRVLGAELLFSRWLDQYLAMRIAENNLAPKSVKILQYDAGLMRERMGGIPIADLSVFHCAEFIDSWATVGKRRMAARMRSQLIKCCDYAISQGLIESNPASKTRPVDVKTQRGRLTKDQFDTIYALASPSIQNAMMLGLVTLQRREDIAVMRFKDVKAGHLYVSQAKTAKAKRGKRQDSTNKAAHLMIGVTDTLKAIIKQCRETGVVSHYMVHHIHGRRSAGATHTVVAPGMPLQPDNITRGFAAARNKSKLFEGADPKNVPTFHEIRSLGAHLYREAGIDPQALLGHTDEKMTRHYLDGHGVEWTVVEANLSV